MFCASVSYSQWQKVGNNILGGYNIIYGGALSSKSGVVWAGLHELWKSIDTGKTWTKTNLNVGSFISEINFFDQNNGAVCIYDQGVFLTRDGGNSWTHILSINHCLGVAFNRTKDEILVADRDNLAGTASYSSDGGISWKTQRIESNGGAYQVLCRPDGRAFILSRSVTPLRESHIYESSDFGISWKKHLTGVDLDSYSFGLDSCKQIYIGNEEFNELDNGFSEIYSSSDGGDSWASVNKQVPKFFSSACASSPNATFVASSLGSGVYRSTDVGQTWQAISGPVSHEDSRMLTVIDDNTIFAVDNSGSVWRTTNSGGFPITPSKSGSIAVSISSKPINNDTLGVDLYLPIYLKVNGAVPSFDMVVHYPAGRLVYLRSIIPRGKVIDIPGEQWLGRSKIHFDSSDLATRMDSLIGYSVFKRLPDNYDCTTVFYDSASWKVNVPCIGIATVTANSAEGIIGAPKSPNIMFSVSSSRIINDSLNVTIYLPIYLKCNTEMPSFDMVIHYPTINLTYQRSISINGKVIDVPGEQWEGRAKVHFDSVDIAARKDSLIGYVVYIWHPYEYDCAHIVFDSMNVAISDNPCSKRGMVSDTATDGIIGSYKTCGESSVADNPDNNIHEEIIFKPNPASEFGSLTTSQYSGHLEIRFINDLGVTLKTEGLQVSSGMPVSLDLQTLPAGVFYLNISCEKFTRVIPFVHLK